MQSESRWAVLLVNLSNHYRDDCLIVLGPVLIDFPIDVLFTPIQEKLISWGSITSPFAYQPAPSPAAIQEAVRLLKSSERPAIITGTGVGSSEVRRISFYRDNLT